MAQSAVGSKSTSSEASDVTMVDPRAPRFGQTTTMSILLLGILLQEPLMILVIAVVLNTAVLSGWRLNLYSVLWQYGIIPLIGKPDETEPAAPHRFAQLMGAFLSAVATILLFGAPALSLPTLAIAGYAVAVVHAGAAAIGGLGNFCIGCRMYKQVAFFRRLGLV